MPAVFWTPRPCAVCGCVDKKCVADGPRSHLVKKVCAQCGADTPPEPPGQWPFNDERARLVELASTLRAAAPEAASLLDVAFHLLTTSTQAASDHRQAGGGVRPVSACWGNVVLRSPCLAAEVQCEAGEIKAVTRLWRDGKLVHGGGATAGPTDSGAPSAPVQSPDSLLSEPQGLPTATPCQSAEQGRQRQWDEYLRPPRQESIAHRVIAFLRCWCARWFALRWMRSGNVR